MDVGHGAAAGYGYGREMAETEARASAQQQWSAPAGTELAEGEPGTPEFEAEMTRTRYEAQPWHPEILRSFAPVGPMLEIGCGAGTDHAELAKCADWTVGIDLAHRGAWLTKRRLRSEGRKGEALVADGELMPFRDAAFNSVYSFGVIHHTDHPERVAAEMARVMVPDGRFLVGLYHRWSWHAFDYALSWLLTGLPRGVSWRRFLARVEFGGRDDAVNPALVRLYSRRSAKALFGDTGCFTELRTEVRHPHLRGVLLPGKSRLGWYVFVTGRRL